MPGFDSNGTRVLIFLPYGRDARLANQVLETAGLACRICTHLNDLGAELANGAGAVLTAEEAVPHGAPSPLDSHIARQPAWSDLPVLVLTQPGGMSPWIGRGYERFGNLTLLERPVRTTALISAMRSALRARQRQYEIRNANERKDEFLAMLAHELRNPMAPISAAGHVLSLAANDPAKVAQCSDIINRQIRHMTTLIEDLLDVARVTRGMIALERKPVDLRQALSEAVEQVNPLIKEKHHHLTLHVADDATLVLGDYKRLIQVIVNLLNNAAKYTPDGGNLAASVTAGNDEVTLEVSDDGIGMTPTVIARAFDTFAQAERTPDRSQGGLGLGLALVKNLISAHGGSIQAESPGLGLGSTFVVRLPRLQVASSEATRAAHGSRQALASKALDIVIVDDNRDAANTLGMLLVQMGHAVRIEHEPETAIEGITASPPGVCLLDIGMPGIDGYEMVRRLKTAPELAQTAFVAVTGYGQERDVDAAREAGFDHHLVKPVEVGRLSAMLAEMAGNRGPRP